MRRSTHWKMGSVAAIVLSVAAAGCGSSSNSSTSSSKNAAASSSNSSTSVKHPTGAPFVIGDITDASTDSTQATVPAAMDAAANYVNQQLGGVKGRPIKIVHCDPRNDASATAACANKLVQQHVTAESGISLNLGICCLKILQTAKIPMFQNPTLPPEWNNPWVFAFGGGEATITGAEGKWLTSKGAKNVVILSLDLPTTRAESARVAATAQGAKVTKLFYKFGIADFTAPVNQVLQKKPDYVVLFGAEPDELKIDALLKQSGFQLDHLIAGNESVDYDSFYKPGGSNVVGMYQTTFFDSFDDTSNPDVAAYRKAMDASGAKARSAFAQHAFSNVVMIARGLGQLSDPTPTALRQYFAQHQNLPIFMGGKTAAAKAPFQSILNPSVNIVQWDGSKLTQTATMNGL